MQRVLRGTQPLRGEHRRFEDGRIDRAIRERGARWIGQRVGWRERQPQSVRCAMDRSDGLIERIHVETDGTAGFEHRGPVGEQR